MTRSRSASVGEPVAALYGLASKAFICGSLGSVMDNGLGVTYVPNYALAPKARRPG